MALQRELRPDIPQPGESCDYQARLKPGATGRGQTGKEHGPAEDESQHGGRGVKGRREGWLGEQSCAEQVGEGERAHGHSGSRVQGQCRAGRRAWTQGPDRKALSFPSYQDRRTAQP